MSANKQIRASLQSMTTKENAQLYFPRLAYCTDNGAMIAYAGCQRLLAGHYDESLEIFAKPRWPVNTLSPL